MGLSTEKKLTLLKEKVQTKEFLEGKGLGNEIPFWIFDYSPKDEMMVRYNIEKISKHLENCSINVLKLDLYEISMSILYKHGLVEKIIGFENDKGSEKALDKTKLSLKPEEITKHIETIMKESDPDVVFLFGIGKAWPLIRSHTILNNLQPVLGNIPMVAFYPGEYSGNDLSLFGKFKDSNYYRAFRLVDQDI